MCGIAGYFSEQIKGGYPILEKMNQAMIHRGPDEGGSHVERHWGFAMRRLSVIDIAGGHQPMWNEDNSVGIVYNGEIYNFKEIRERLRAKGFRFRTLSDTEVLLRLYEDRKHDCVQELNGMFAFAVYDRRDDSFFLARDRMGEKPLHYYDDGRQFVFGSEIKSILQFPGLDVSMSLEALTMYLSSEYVPAPLTIYRKIFKLLPGERLVYHQGNIARDFYWKLSFKEHQKHKSEQEWMNELEFRIQKSIALRTVSDVPLGAFLSGGIDSSLITAMLARQLPGKVKTFSIGFDESSFDESPYALKVAKYLGTEHHEERLTSKTMLDLLPSIIGILDEPFADASLIPTYLLAQHARKTVTVALSGDGGDELFGGYPTYQAHKVARWFPRCFGPVMRGLASRLPVSDENISWDFAVKRFCAGISYDLPARNQIWLGAFEPKAKRELFLEPFRKRIMGYDEFAFHKKIWAQCDSRNYLNQIWNLDLRFYLQDDMLVKVDRASMANSLEVRVPYLDHTLVEFVCAMPTHLKLKGFSTKYILKKVAEKYLPNDIIHRKKKGFGIPVAKWIKAGLKPMILDVLTGDSIKEAGIFHPEYIQGLLDDHFLGKRDFRKLLWTLFIFECWRQSHKQTILA